MRRAQQRLGAAGALLELQPDDRWPGAARGRFDEAFGGERSEADGGRGHRADTHEITTRHGRKARRLELERRRAGCSHVSSSLNACSATGMPLRQLACFGGLARLMTRRARSGLPEVRRITTDRRTSTAEFPTHESRLALSSRHLIWLTRLLHRHVSGVSPRSRGCVKMDMPDRNRTNLDCRAAELGR